MRLLLVAHNLVRGDGQGRINYEIVRRAMEFGHGVTIIADSVAPELVAGGAKWIPVQPWFSRPNLLKVRPFLRKANRLVRELRADHDFVFANGYVLTEPHDVNLCQFVHGAWGRSQVHVARLHRGPYAWYQRFYTSFNSVGEKRAYGASRWVIAPSNKIVDDLVSIGIPAAKIRVVYNGVDVEEFRPDHAFDRASLPLPVGVPMGVFAGDIRTPRKNLDSVLKALVHVPKAQLAVIGKLDNSPFPALALELGVADRVHFLGYRRDVSQIMPACDFFIFPSRYEAGSLVILEALACGLPVISVSSAGGAELVGTDAGVVLDDSEDIVGLTKAIQRLLDDPALCRAQSSAARAIAERHTWDMMADDYLALCAERES